MLLACSFGDLKTCDVQNFSLYQNPTYYNCYTLTGGNETAADTAALVASSMGPNQGLSVVAYMENDSGLNVTNATYYTLSAIGNSMGLRITIHQPGTKAQSSRSRIRCPTWSISQLRHTTSSI